MSSWPGVSLNLLHMCDPRKGGFMQIPPSSPIKMEKEISGLSLAASYYVDLWVEHHIEWPLQWGISTSPPDDAAPSSFFCTALDTSACTAQTLQSRAGACIIGLRSCPWGHCKNLMGDVCTESREYQNTQKTNAYFPVPTIHVLWYMTKSMLLGIII